MIPAKFSKAIARGVKYALNLDMVDECFENTDLSDAAIKQLAQASDKELNAVVASLVPEVKELLTKIMREARRGAKDIADNEF